MFTTRKIKSVLNFIIFKHLFKRTKSKTSFNTAQRLSLKKVVFKKDFDSAFCFQLKFCVSQVIYLIMRDIRLCVTYVIQRNLMCVMDKYFLVTHKTCSSVRISLRAGLYFDTNSIETEKKHFNCLRITVIV